MRDLSALILNAISKKSYQPMSPKALARKLGLAETSYREFRGALRGPWSRRERPSSARTTRFARRRRCPRPSAPSSAWLGGDGIVRVESEQGLPPQEYYVPDHLTHDAANGDEVDDRGPAEALRTSRTGWPKSREVVRRATRQFVGTYFERDGDQLRPRGRRSLHAQRRGRRRRSKGAKPNDKVVLEMIRFPTAR